jgi:hypothetical protein
VADRADSFLAAVRKHLEARRQEIAEKFPRNLSPEEYNRHCGRHEEVESLAAAVQDIVRKINSPEDEDDDPDTT